MAAERPLLLRASSACDSCAIRRVRCDAGAPCEECRVRSMRCTYFHTRKKRGPKGPRQSTTLKILELQRKADLDSLGSGQHGDSSGSPTSSPPPPSEALCASMMDNLELLGATISPCLDPFESLTLESYFHHLDIFHERLYSIWPVILTQELKQRMSSFPTDFGTYALAAAVCAATITQLGLPGNSEGFDQPSSPHFALIAQCAYQMGHAPYVGAADPVLLPFFLHVYFANTGNLRAAGDYLQRAVTALQWQQFNQDTANSPTDTSIQHMELFCLVFNTERSAKE
ncbi:hypothetical protein NLG97_g1217 [Lecanicillium saksenae]|uniref:Uncharacterized protein n=1 Tax=Lecanicillium saksenae TaxID=468837 RepID=A0ACC1R6A6_9HYPO|nr:hypothetical protein NLG97_g1217 [Lecanicillium saksenae]